MLSVMAPISLVAASGALLRFAPMFYQRFLGEVARPAFDTSAIATLTLIRLSWIKIPTHLSMITEHSAITHVMQIIVI